MREPDCMRVRMRVRQAEVQVAGRVPDPGPRCSGDDAGGLGSRTLHGGKEHRRGTVSSGQYLPQVG